LRIQAHVGFRYAWPHAVQRGGLEDRDVHDPLRHQPLHLVQQRLAFAAVAFDGLLWKSLSRSCEPP
jgi:hypothetical protein